MLFKNKKGAIQKSLIWVFVAIALIALIYNSQHTSAAKADQYFVGNLTCEEITDSVLWTLLSGKSAANSITLNWTPGTSCLGVKNCDMEFIRSFVRYTNVGTKDLLAGSGLIRIGNTTQPNGTVTRHMAYLNETVLVGESLGPRYECGLGTTPTTCSLLGQGFNESDFNYSVFFQSGQASAGSRELLDNFEVVYPWCWTPIIYDATVSPESADNATTFTFTINVTNPGANTTVRLLTRPVGGAWEQEGNQQNCINCAQTKLSFNADFPTRIGNREFKFNATDNQSFSTEAGNPARLETATNECLDTGNDCQFEVTQEAVASVTPFLANETVNGQQSDATEGWGTNWTFSVNVSNPVDGAGDINLTLLVDSGGGFVVKDTVNCTGPCSTSTKFTFFVDDFMCTDISNAQYRFTATNLNGTSTITQPFTIEKDDINIEHVLGNNTIANRSGSQLDLLILRVFDTDKAPSGEYIGSETNGVTFDSGTINQTNSSGHVNYYFNPSCTPTKYLVGNQDWKGDVLSS